MTKRKLVAKHLPLAELLGAVRDLQGWIDAPLAPGQVPADKREMFYWLRDEVIRAARKFVEADAADAAALATEILHFSAPERVQ